MSRNNSHFLSFAYESVINLLFRLATSVIHWRFPFSFSALGGVVLMSITSPLVCASTACCCVLLNTFERERTFRTHKFNVRNCLLLSYTVAKGWAGAISKMLSHTMGKIRTENSLFFMITSCCLRGFSRKIIQFLSRLLNSTFPTFRRFPHFNMETSRMSA